MLGKTAGGIYWMFRYLERMENTARLIEAGFRVALTRPDTAQDEWLYVLTAVSSRERFQLYNDDLEGEAVIDFLLRDKDNPSSVRCMMQTARDNARLVRTAITREVWEAVNESWMRLTDALNRPIPNRDLPEVLALIKQQSELVRGALHGSMLRNDGYDFARIGTFMERADSTARILNVKFHVLLPSIRHIGSTADNIQWESILRSVGGQRAFRWLHQGSMSQSAIVEFLMLDARMPRSLFFCTRKLCDNLGYLEGQYGERHPSHDISTKIIERLQSSPIGTIFEYGLQETVSDYLDDIQTLGVQIETDYRFSG
jgi:uncharacterized alpha-E superfamily protein